MAIASRVKLFEKSLIEGDILNGLILEVDSEFPFLPADGFNEEASYFDFDVMDEEQMPWHFWCFTGCSRVAGVQPLIILDGWDEFVQHYDLKVKDKVILYDDQNKIVIHVRKTIRLFGVDITQPDDDNLGVGVEGLFDTGVCGEIA